MLDRASDFKSLIERIHGVEYYANNFFCKIYEEMKHQNGRKPPLNNTKMFFGGGCLRDTLIGKPFNDIDVFFESKDYYQQVKSDYLRTILPGFLGWDFTSNYAVTYTFKVLNTMVKVQFITPNVGLCGTINQIYKTFDFTINTFFLDGDSVLHFSNDAMGHLLRRELILVNNNTDYSKLLKRTSKFLKEGYSISDKELKKLTNRDMNTTKVVQVNDGY